MAWFRCGGSGIPASLKSGMNSVLNKKFGTSTTYDPSGWPDAVNLLGPLPIKSASGAIASFADGADGVPVKSCVVSFVASGGGGTPSAPVAITGVSGVAVTRCGKNLYDFNGKEYNVPFHDASGNVVQYADCATNVIKVSASTQYTFSITKETSRTVNVRIVYLKADKSFISRDGLYSDSQFPRTVTTPSNCGYLEITINQYSTAQIDQNEWKLQIEKGSTATTYEAYTSSVVTDTFGQTIYGGTRDLTTDKASVTWGYIASYNGETLTGRWVSSMDTYVAGTTPTTGAEVAYELATPTEITGLTPHEIDTLYGDNNIYADTGTMEVEYRADIDLALNA